MISDVIGWKFNHQSGMRCKEVDGVMTIVEFPGGIPSQSLQNQWTDEYNAWMASGGWKDEIADIEIQFNDTLKAFALVVLDEINALRANAGLQPRTITQLKTAVKSKL